MLRIHFTAADLARIRLVAEPAPLLETAFSLELLLRRQGGAVFDPWRDLVGNRNPAPLPILRHLIGPSGLWPAFLAATQTDLDTAWDVVRSTPRARLRKALLHIDGRRHLPGWGRTLAEGDTEFFDRLVREYRAYHAAAIAPVWRMVVRGCQAELRMRTALLAARGAEQLLGTLHPAVRWEPPTLLCQLPEELYGDVHLHGQGLRLLPSVFARSPDFADADGTPTIIYPVDVGANGPFWLSAQDGCARLAQLLGRTRATVLDAIARHGIASTSELAHALDIPLAAVSKHTSVLRANGLITSHRDKHRVIHLATQLGETLLNDTSRA